MSADRIIFPSNEGTIIKWPPWLAPEGCGCGYGNTVQLADGSLVSVFSFVEFYNRTGTTDQESHLGAVKWRL